MRKLLLLGVIASVALASQGADKDPVLMTVAGEPVTLSEFEYLYHKNNQQQIEKETLEQYIERFVVYKLKVADARAAGIDTTRAFQEEFAKYRDDLASPYLVDSATIERLVEEAYARKTHEREVAHIMLSLNSSPEATQATYARLDSIRSCILAGEDFGDLAEKYSIDRSVSKNRGNQGYVSAGRFPIEFEIASFETPVGEISEPFATDYGIHIVKVLSERESQGEVLVEHILRLYPRDATDSVKNLKKLEMDSIYQAIVDGADFEEMAKAKSEDPGSAADGGRLQWFGTGVMVPQFEKVAFDLAVGELSEPFETSYGYHIVKKLDSRGIGTLEENRDKLLRMINNDKRRNMPREAKIAQLKEKHKYKENAKFFKNLEKRLDATPYDSLLVEELKADDTEMFRIAKQKTPVSEVAQSLNPAAKFETSTQAMFYIRTMMGKVADSKVTEYEKEDMKTSIPEYGNLVNEYYNGMMLYEISNRNVWGKANSDTVGMEKYFEENRANYQWEQPKFKGVVIYVTNDSVDELVKTAMAEMDADTLLVGLKNRFRRDVRIEKVLVPQGENSVVDALVFGGERVPSPQKRYEKYFLYEGRIIEAPEDVADVRGVLTTDYQNKLESDWVEELRAKYPVTIDEKVYEMIE